jgi:hypothetical protein
MQPLDVTVADVENFAAAELGLDPLPDQAQILAPAVFALLRQVLDDIPVAEFAHRRRAAFRSAVGLRVLADVDPALQGLRLLAGLRRAPIGEGADRQAPLDAVGPIVQDKALRPGLGHPHPRSPGYMVRSPQD